MIRNFLMGGVAACGLLAALLPASAADLSVAPAPAPTYVAPVVPAFTWSGWYIGGNLGGKWGKYSGSVTGTAVPGFPVTAGGDGFTFSSDRDSAFIGGGQLGFNWQVGQFVFGVEGDIDATRIRDNFALGFTPGGGVFIPGDVFRFKNDWQASVRGRGGIAFDRFLVYATGGVAWAGVRAEALYSPGFVGRVAVPGAFASDSKTLTGATIGGGVEFAVTNNVTFGVEYRYSDFGHETFNLGAVPFPAGAGSAVTSRVDLRTHEVTGRLNFKFGGLFLP